MGFGSLLDLGFGFPVRLRLHLEFRFGIGSGRSRGLDSDFCAVFLRYTTRRPFYGPTAGRPTAFQDAADLAVRDVIAGIKELVNGTETEDRRVYRFR